MTIKRIYGTSLGDARQRALIHYGKSFILLESHEAGKYGNAFISIMIEDETDNPVPFSEKTRSFLNELMSPFRSGNQNVPSGPVIRRDSKVVHPGVMYSRGGTVPANGSPANDSLHTEKPAPVIKPRYPDYLYQKPVPVPDVSSQGVNVPCRPVKPSASPVHPSTQEKSTHHDNEARNMAVAVSRSLPEMLVEAGFTERFALKLTKTAGKVTTAPTYKEVRQLLETKLGMLFQFDPRSSQIFTGLPGEGRTTLIRSIPDNNGQIQYRHLKIDTFESLVKVIEDEHRIPDSADDLQNTHSYQLIDAPPLPSHTRDAREYMRTVQSLPGMCNHTMHIVADAGIELRSLSRLASSAVTAKNLRFSFTQLNEPGNVAKVLEFIYTNIVRPGYFFREGLNPFTDFNDLLGMLDQTIRENTQNC